MRKKFPKLVYFWLPDKMLKMKARVYVIFYLTALIDFRFQKFNLRVVPKMTFTAFRNCLRQPGDLKLNWEVLGY